MATINIFGFIGSEWDGNTLKQVSDQLDAITENEVTVKISSGGGYVHEGMAIFNLLRNSKKTVRVEIIGQAYSIASVIAMAGDKIYIAKFADMMLHPAWTFAEGNAEDLRKTADELDAISKEIFNVYLTRSVAASNEAALKSYFDEEKYIKADECIALGLADGILEDQASAKYLTRYKAVAYFDKPKSQENMTTLTKDEAKGMFDEFRNWIKATFTTKHKNASTPTTEGTLYYEGDTLAVDIAVFSDEAMTVPAADGTYNTNDNVITVANGVVASIVEQANDAAKQEIADLTAKLEAANAELQAANAERETLKAELETLNAKVGEFDAKINELQNKVIGGMGNPSKQKEEGDAPVRKLTAAGIMNDINKRNNNK